MIEFGVGPLNCYVHACGSAVPVRMKAMQCITTLHPLKLLNSY